MDKKYYLVTFQYSDNIYCSNIAHGTEANVKKRYNRYEWVVMRLASESDIREAQCKGKPFIEC